MINSRIFKIYLSNFLVGFIFWYGIEKLFMASIGISAAGIGIAAAFFLGASLIFEIPSGVLADKWSRKGMLVASSLLLGLSSIVFGISNGLFVFIIGEVFYGLYIATMSGTYQALIYDILSEEKISNQYSRVAGKAFALFLFGSAVADFASGFLANQIGFRSVFFISAVSCILNIMVMLSIREPKIHKIEQKHKILPSLKHALIDIYKNNLLRSLTIIMSVLAVMELFKAEFSQLYMIRYVSSMELIGILWAVYALTWALGSLIAHRFRTRLDGLVVLTILPYIVMSFVDNWFSIVLFMFQTVVSAVLINQIETRVQENTPSSSRASVMSVLSSLGRAISIPSSFLIGWIISTYDVLWAVRFVATLGVVILIYWLISRRNINQKSEVSIIASPSILEIVK